MARGSVVAAFALLLVLAPAASAADDYVGGKVPVVKGTELSRPAAAAPAPRARAQEADPDDRIPITGGDVAGLTAMGLASLGVGVALTRRARRPA